jgi:hypothetical protein
MLLAFVLGCGDEYEPDCNQPMPSTDEDGAPWPSYSVASAELADCGQIEDYYLRRSGSCSDGKRFLDKGSGFVGDTLYFDGETIVGRTEWSDFVICDPWRYGDTRCNEREVEEIMCP